MTGVELSDPLVREDIESALRQAGVSWGKPLHVLSTTESTNAEAVRAAVEGTPHGTVFVADTQSSGRGRRGRSWFSPPGQGVYASCVLRPGLTPEQLPSVSVAMGLAIRDALATVVPASTPVGLKWPNDVLVGGKKLAGVLAEAAVQAGRCEYVVVGFGVNVGMDSFPEELADVAISLRALGGRASRLEVLVACLASMEKRLQQLEVEGLAGMQTDLAHWDMLKGRHVEVNGVRGVVVGIDGRGRLQLRKPDGDLVAFGSGEATLHRSGG